MMGGNPENGWCHRTRNPGAFDITEHKERLNVPQGLRMWASSARELTMEDIRGLMCRPLNNKQENLTPIGKESEIGFRRAYL